MTYLFVDPLGSAYIGCNIERMRRLLGYITFDICGDLLVTSDGPHVGGKVPYIDVDRTNINKKEKVNTKTTHICQLY